MNKELTLEKAEIIVDNMYQNRWKECGVEEGNTIHMGNLSNLKYNELESASILLLRTEIRLKREIKKLQQKNEKLRHYKTLYQSLKRQKEELRDYLKARIEVCDNRLSMPFCNPEKATKERLIFSQCLEKLEELEQGSDNKWLGKNMQK